jgi:hypothetical protein
MGSASASSMSSPPPNRRPAVLTGCEPKVMRSLKRDPAGKCRQQQTSSKNDPARAGFMHPHSPRPLRNDQEEGVAGPRARRCHHQATCARNFYGFAG